MEIRVNVYTLFLKKKLDSNCCCGSLHHLVKEAQEALCWCVFKLNQQKLDSGVKINPFLTCVNITPFPLVRCSTLTVKIASHIRPTPETRKLSTQTSETTACKPATPAGSLRASPRRGPPASSYPVGPPGPPSSAVPCHHPGPARLRRRPKDHRNLRGAALPPAPFPAPRQPSAARCHHLPPARRRRFGSGGGRHRPAAWRGGAERGGRERRRPPGGG